MTGTQAQESTVNPKKWLATLREWVPAEPSEVFVELINSLIEASGRARVEGLDELITHIDGTTRSGREKLERLRQWSEKMRADPWYWPQRFVRPRTISSLIKPILDKASRPLNRFEIEQKFRKFRDVPPSGLSQELKEMARRGEIDRFGAGLYWRKGTAVKPYESQTRQLYRLVHDAPGHRMPNAELAIAMNISRKDLETLLSQMRKRWRDPPLFEGPTGHGVIVVSAESLDVLKRDGRIVDGRGGTFFAAAAAPLDRAVFTALRAERPRVDRNAQAEKVASLRRLEGEHLKVALTATAKELGSDPADLAERLSRSAQRYLRKDRARERWREEATRLMEQYPERSPKPLRDLFKDLRIDGLTREIFTDVIREVAAALLREKGLKTSWSAPGAPPRG